MRDTPRQIDPKMLYPLPTAQALTGWGRAAMRRARREGLEVSYCGREGFVHGRDLIGYITTQGRATK